MGVEPVIINMEDICYAYPGGGEILNHIHFSLQAGEKVGLIGGNGSGKTTLLHIIIGILQANSGKLTVFDEAVRSEKDFFRVRQRVGLLFQNSDDQLFSPTVLEDVAFGLLNQGKKPSDACDIARQTLRDLNLGGFEDRVTHTLSGGEKKLVALATILTMQPEILLLDEPTSGLDEATKNRLTEILQGLAISYIIVSHEYDFLIANTDTIYGMKAGILTYHGDSAYLHSHYHSHPAGKLPHQHSVS
ncbi:energy-coupling factor ABC transporter ATP-binding protein [bacterium]|nr:energy-coupling factor ABC transporter ATP-binding protein [bacterium]